MVQVYFDFSFEKWWEEVGQFVIVFLKEEES